MMQSSLWSFVESDAQKLGRRLARQGIKSIAAMEYEQYLRSTLWKKIREWVLERDGATCTVCQSKHYNPNKDGMEIHHRDYSIDTLEGRHDAMLVTLCPRCHHKVEHYANGVRRTSIQEKDVELQRLITLHKSIVEDGLILKVLDASTHRGKKLHLFYAGPLEYNVFYTLEDFAAGLIYGYWNDNLNLLRIPIPFSRDKLFQKTGACVINKESNKKELIVKVRNNVVEITQPTNALYDISSYLRSHIDSRRYWKLDDASILEKQR
ncbi:MAG: hypothetical protein WD071_10760 [Pseudohongiella sp.]|uniref:HNH endonuclease n=1 Tax=Pseudohongiella sp. TaxID=1979412 RepID=UPI0034A053E2